MPILILRNLHLSFGDPPLLDGIDLAIEPGERLCLLGRNGEGKSTLLRLIAGEITADDGECIVAQGVRVARLEQDVPADINGTVFAVVADGAGDKADLLKCYHAASLAVATDPGTAALARLERVQHELEVADGWRVEQQVEQTLSRLGLDGDAAFESLSGGRKRRVLLGRALVTEPDLLLLDEPTNHLDIDSILWLETFLADWPGALVFITHDRGFLQRLATRIAELDRGRLIDYPGDYENYLRRRAERDNAETQANAQFDKRLAQEEAWVRQGIKARRTRNEGRVRRLESMRRAYGERRSRQGKAKLALTSAERSGKLVVEATGVGYAWSGQPIIKDFDTTILRGDRIGIVGPNGCGKSTLLKLLLGELTPSEGTVERGTRLDIAYFDQLRGQLDLDRTVIDNVAGGSDKVVINGKSRHVIGYLQDFLFPPQRSRQPARALSGGERNRLLLAKLFTRPANLLVMDEPTNDLDIETLELLEELLLDFDGTLLLVSHDRAFIDNVVTSTLVFEGDGRVASYVGGYSDWLRQRPQHGASDANRTKPVDGASNADKQVAEPTQSLKPKKRSYKDQRELEQLPGRIEALEGELSTVQDALGDPELYRSGGDKVAELDRRRIQLESDLAEAYERWAVLED